MLKSGGPRLSEEGRNYRDYNFRLSPDQLRTLESEFTRGRTLHSTDLALLAMEIGADEKDVQNWYHVRVASWRRDQGLSDCFGQI